ncbi:hypothetical protein [Phaeobacter sp. C3_T13_0]|uniref:hypothetical protein n=1 Tax=Phaeobacter cretensis TaxID=3342641 RepID=UPI0039BC5E8B
MGEIVIRDSVRNLLVQCAGAQENDRVLVVGEAGSNTFFEPQLAIDFAREATEIGFRASHILAEPVVSAQEFPTTVAAAMAEADITVFFSRLGDQVRFLASPGKGGKVMSYALTRRHMASDFGATDFATTEYILEQLLEVISSASSYRIFKANGTDLVGEIRNSSEETDLIPFSLKLFPTMIFPPIGFRNLSGTLLVEDFTLSTSTRAYQNSVLMMTSPVKLTIESGRIVAFEGETEMIAALKEQCRRAASITGGDPFRLNSWHTGVNPFTFFEGDPFANLERWGTVAYGSPRYTHIHAAGQDPGDLSFQLFDASIAFDDEWIWKDGRFVFLDREDIRDMLDKAGQGHLTSDIRYDIGI